MGGRTDKALTAALGQANYIHSLASATSPHYMRAGGNLIAVVRILSVSINIHAPIQDTAEYSLDALPSLQLGATPLKFGPNQLEAGSQRGMRALMLNYKCSLPGLIERARGEVLLHQYLHVALVAGKDPRHSFAHALGHLCMRWHMLKLPTLGHR